MVDQTLAARGAPARSGARWWILAFVAGAQLMVVLDTTIMLIALPSASTPYDLRHGQAVGDHRLHHHLRRAAAARRAAE